MTLNRQLSEFVPAASIEGDNSGRTNLLPETSGLGYHTDGGAVTQETSASTGVELNKYGGQITTVALSTAAGVSEVFTVTNSKVDATDVPVVAISAYAGNGIPTAAVKKTTTGAFDIVVTNRHASAALNAAVIVNFAIIKTKAA